MNTENAKRIKDVLIAILIIVGVLAILPAIFIASRIVAMSFCEPRS